MRPSILKAQFKEPRVIRPACMSYPCALIPRHADGADFPASWLDIEQGCDLPNA